MRSSTIVLFRAVLFASWIVMLSGLYFQVCVQKVASMEPLLALETALHRSTSSSIPDSHGFLPFQPVA